MKSKFIQNYERNLVESAVESALNNRDQEIAEKMKKMNYPPSDILKITGINILVK